MSSLVEKYKPQELTNLLGFQLPQEGKGKDGLLSIVERILHYSVNTWDRGFMHKLSASTNAVGLVSELVLSVLNANVISFLSQKLRVQIEADRTLCQLHVYEVSPVLTTIEKKTGRALALLFNLVGPYAGGLTMPGGSASNTTALVIARNELFPKTKSEGYGGKKFVLFASAHGHYSLEKAAQVCGLGSSNAWLVPVDSHCRMIASELERLIRKAREEGFTPFFVSASAGTTVMGAFDPFLEIAKICRREKLWFHIDASWGGPVVFSAKQKHKLHGSEFADSVTINPHKMMGVPLTCSFLLGADLRRFWRANTLPAGYLFHENNGEDGSTLETGIANGCNGETDFGIDCWDLADLTLQCGRRGDALKLALGWIYYGSSGYGAQIDRAFDTAAHFASLVATNDDLELLSENPPPCLQVCFYFAPGGHAGEDESVNTRTTKQIARELVKQGFMVDFAPGERGLFFRAVVHLVTTGATVEALIKAVVHIGKKINFTES